MPDLPQLLPVVMATPVRTIHPEALLRLNVVREITGLSSSSIYRRMAKGTFPLPKALGDRIVAWPATRVLEWMDRLPDAEIRPASMRSVHGKSA